MDRVQHDLETSPKRQMKGIGKSNVHKGNMAKSFLAVKQNWSHRIKKVLFRTIKSHE